MSEINKLSDYLLVRCFDKKQYLDELINGECLHMNSVQKFREASNKFQGDPNDCAVIVDNEVLSGSFYLGNDFPEEQFAKANLCQFEINGYLYCFFALPKNIFKVENDILMLDVESPHYKLFLQCLNAYKENSETNECYVGIFDAASLVGCLRKSLDSIGLSYVYGFINYEKLDSNERMKLLSERNPEKIVLTKDPSYNYQNEFRFFVRTDKDIEDWLQIKGLKLTDILAMRFVYNPCENEVLK